MTASDALRLAIGPALSLLPSPMDSVPARAMLLAIAMQESRLEHRRQIGGPARGFWQFEVAGVRGVLEHRATADLVRDALGRLAYSRGEPAQAAHAAIEHNDVLAAVFARLLLYSLPVALPKAHDPTDGWRQYLAAWRPGKPHPATWARFYADAWAAAQWGAFA